MKKRLLNCLVIMFLLISIQGLADNGKNGHKKSPRYLREMPMFDIGSLSSAEAEEFKPSIQVGAIVHMYGKYQQFGPMQGSSETWVKGFDMYRARVLVGGQLSKNGSFFMETELPSVAGFQGNDSIDKNVSVSPVILDAQYEHQLGGGHMVVVGKQLVSHTRNGLQGAAGLLANDFTFVKYPYNLFKDQPLQNNFGRDLGVNFRGFLMDDKLEYRLGAFTGRNDAADAPLRYVGRLAYNLFDAEKDYYYAGTKLGTGKTVALAAGFDMQGTYSSVGADLFIDLPMGPGSFAANTAISFLNGGTDRDVAKAGNFTHLIPKQTTLLGEFGYYFPGSKLQPFIRYERQAFDPEQVQAETASKSVEEIKDGSTTFFGGGLNYWFAGYNTNARVSYTTAKQDKSGAETYGQLWLQLQFFIF